MAQQLGLIREQGREVAVVPRAQDERSQEMEYLRSIAKRLRKPERAQQRQRVRGRERGD